MTGRPRPRDPRSRVAAVDDGHDAVVVRAGVHDDPATLLARTGLMGTGRRPAIVVCGGADELSEPELSVAREMLGPAVAVAAGGTGAAVVDGGTASGVMERMGAQRARGGDDLPLLLGVAPAGRVAEPGAPSDGRAELDPYHTHFVLADSAQLGGETTLLAAMAQELSGGGPIVMVLAGGGGVARREARESVARRWPLFVIESTGGEADAIAKACRRPRSPRRRAADAIEDPELRAIVMDGDVRLVTDPDPTRLGRAPRWELTTNPV